MATADQFSATCRVPPTAEGAAGAVGTATTAVVAFASADLGLIAPSTPTASTA